MATDINLLPQHIRDIILHKENPISYGVLPDDNGYRLHFNDGRNAKDIPLKYDPEKMETVLDQVYKSAFQSIKIQFEDQIIKRLGELNYNFSSREEFYVFQKERLTVVELAEFLREMYLDYQKPKQILIGTWNHSIITNWDLGQWNTTTFRMTYNPK